MGSKFGTDSVRAHAGIYMIVHMLGVMLSYTWPYSTITGYSWLWLNLYSPGQLPVHFGYVIFILLRSTWLGSGHYEFIFARKYVNVLNKLLEESNQHVAPKNEEA